MGMLAFVHGRPPVQRIRELRDRGATVVALDIAADLALTAAGIPHKDRKAYRVPDSAKNAVDWLNAWSCKPVQNGRTIKDVLAHGDFSFWWCMEEWFYYSFVYRDPLKSVIEMIDVVQAVLQAERPEKVAFIDDGTLPGKVIRMLARGKELIPLRQARPVLHRVKEALRPWAIKQFFRVHTAARRALWRWYRLRARSRPQEKRGKKVLIAFAYQWRMVDHPALSAPTLGDPYTTPIGEQLTGAAVTYVDCTQRAYVGFAPLRQKAQSAQRHVVLEQYLSLQQVREARRLTRALRHAAQELERSPAFLRSWTYQGVDLWPLMAPQFRSYFRYRLEGHVRDFVCVGALLEHERPDLVVYPSEGGDLAYVFFAHAARRGIPAVALQHGTLPYSPLTVHLPEEVCHGSPRCIPQAKRYLVYGPYYRDFLVSHTHFPKEKFVVIGNLRYDHFGKAKELSKQAMAEKYGLPPDKPVVMFLTQILPSDDEMEQLARSVFSATKELGLPLIVKMHPGEMSDARYHELAREFDLKPIITKTASTLELLIASDVLIGAESTLDYEAMILGKPVIVLNFSGAPNTLPFVDEHAALGVFAPQDVLPALKRMLFDAKARASFDKGMRDLVEAHCYKTDGKTATRAVAAIKELLA